MLQKLAVKRLSASDLTFFLWHFKNRPAGNQKSINLNADVFVDRLYPALAEVEAARLPLDLYIYGPGMAGERNVQRKIIKGESYKNWRLNGEFVYPYPDEPEDRYNILKPSDVVIFEFFGEPQPIGARAVFLAQDDPDDGRLQAEFARLVPDPGRSMAVLTPMELACIIERADPKPEHPIRILLLDLDLKDAALNNQTAIERLRLKLGFRKVSEEELVRARRNADRVGKLGEQYVNRQLAQVKAQGEIREFRWASRENAIEPYDFEAILPDESRVLIEVKATEGEFNRDLHISLNELIRMANTNPPVRYVIYRVYQMSENSANLRITADVSEWARRVLASLASLPTGIRVDSISVSPESLTFGEDLLLQPFTADEDA